MVRLLLLPLAALGMMAQTQIDLRTQARNVDFSAAMSTKPLKTGTLLPAVCATGELFFKSDAPPGANLYACTGANIWSVETGQSCQLDSTQSALQCLDMNGNLTHVTATFVNAIADPEGNGIAYRSGPGTAQPATATLMSAPFWCQDNGTVNAYACALSPNIAAYSTGTTYWFQAHSSNTGPSTVSFNGVGAKPIVKQAGQSLAAGDITAGQWVIITFDGVNMQMQSQTAAGPALTVQNDGTLVGTRGVENFITGPGLMSVITDDGTTIGVQSAVDTALVQTQPGEQSGVALLCVSASNSVNNYQCSLSPTAAAYQTGMVLHWKPDVNGAGGPTTLNVDGLGPVPLKSASGAANPGPTDIVSGQLYPIWYDGTAFRFWTAPDTKLADPGANGILYRNSSSTTAPATANNLGAPMSCQDAGAPNAYSCNLIPAITNYQAGASYWFQAATTNTGASTIALNSLSPVPIKKYRAQDLLPGDIQAGQWVMMTYDGSNMQMQSQPGNTPTAPVSTVFGRTGAVAAQPGDYSASQVTNAVDQTGSYSNPSWITNLSWARLTGVPSAFTPTLHAATHQNGGADEIATSTPSANAIPKATTSGQLSPGWIPTLNQNTSGNAATATALQNAPSNCSPGSYPLGIDIHGNSLNCTVASATGLVQEVAVTLNSAQILALGTGANAIQVIAAPGLGKVIQILAVIYKYVYGGTAYTSLSGSATGYLAYDANANYNGVQWGASGDLFKNVLTASTNRIAISQPGNAAISGIPDNAVLNQPVYLVVFGGPFTTGNGTVTLVVDYLVRSGF